MQLYVKRSKIFFDNSGKTERRIALDAGPQLQQAPDWIHNAPGFELGIKDGSIVVFEPPLPQPQPQEKGESSARKNTKK